MAQNLEGRLIRPTLQSQKKILRGQKKSEIPYFQVSLKKPGPYLLWNIKIRNKDYDLVETNLPPGEAFTGFERICDLDRFKKQQTFFNRAYITSDS